MSVNKKAQIRYKVYDRCLKNTYRKYTRQELLKEVDRVLEDEGLVGGISKSQFHEDIKTLKGPLWQAPIATIKDGKTSLYFYTNRNYSIDNMPLNETEIKQLISAVEIMTRIKGREESEWVNEIIPALESKLIHVRPGKEAISYERNDDYEGLKHIANLFNAIVNKRVQEVCYKPFDSDAFIIEFHPHYLKQYNNRWFVFGYNPQKDEYKFNLALDRIVSIESKHNECIDDITDWEEYFSDFIGPTKDKNEEMKKIILWVTKKQANYIRTKPLHQTQKEVRSLEDWVEFSIEVIPNYELESLILSFGERVKVLSPESFQRTIAERIKKASELYKMNEHQDEVQFDSINS